MSTTYTEADVRRWASTVYLVSDNPTFESCVDSLRSLALEGVKVPGLEEEVVEALAAREEANRVLADVAGALGCSATGLVLSTDDIVKAVQSLKSERDTLRAQVKAVRSKLDDLDASADEAAEVDAAPGGAKAKRSAAIIRETLREVGAALSTPPAEAKKP